MGLGDSAAPGPCMAGRLWLHPAVYCVAVPLHVYFEKAQCCRGRRHRRRRLHHHVGKVPPTGGSES